MMSLEQRVSYGRWQCGSEIHELHRDASKQPKLAHGMTVAGGSEDQVTFVNDNSSQLPPVV